MTASTNEERDTRIPYRLGTNHYCKYDDGGNVRMGEKISCFHDTPFGEVEIYSVTYGEGGFIEDVSVYVEGKDRAFDCPCDGVFYRMKDGRNGSTD